MPIRRRAWLTREGWYYLAILAFIIGGAVLRSVNLLVVLAGTMIAPLLFNWRLVMASLMGLEVRRVLPEQILAGEPLTVEIEVHNPRRWMSSWLVTVEDWVEREGDIAKRAARSGQGSGFSVQAGSRTSNVEGRRSWADQVWSRLQWAAAAALSWRARRGPARAEALLAHVPASGSARGTYRLTLFRRGRYRFGPLRVATRFPLGLVRGKFTVPSRAHLIVAPRLGRLLPEWTLLLEADLVGEERRQPQRGASEGDYYGLRPWQAGDSLRWIHWRTTAKLARPIVRQYERRRGREVALVLDPWLPGHATELDEGRAELAVSLVATAISDITRRGHLLLTLAIAGQPATCLSGPASEMFCQELLARLAELRLTARPALATAINEALAAAPRGARMIVVSPRPANDPSLDEHRTELPLDPEQLTWIDTSSPELGRLFVIEGIE